MKKITLFIIVTFFSLTTYAQELTWHTDMAKASELSLKKKKPMLLFFTGSDWCGWCIRLQKEVLQTPEFAKWAKKNVILVELDFPKRTPQDENLRAQNQNLQQMFGIRGYPTIWFVSPEKTKEGKMNLKGLGSTGYVAGGPTKWLDGASKIVANK
ncbi:MAG: thioredoxin family protein [Flavobacterium sp.]|uniref:thioredoxin family protein n=1 Tax=Flavobacterium sp. TaxID=239 RepID=UPI000C47B6DD|nr:thioredoxin family protein [Flavobacterium sp.]MBF03510.1 thioredoxin family protein [Flavobacterium sp.]|tara:strand:+ start:140 stop:604 length:465 start_codon:yes stop_codon:yes gene_type:complete